MTWDLFVEKRYGVKLRLGKSPFHKYHFYLLLFLYKEICSNISNKLSSNVGPIKQTGQKLSWNPNICQICTIKNIFLSSKSTNNNGCRWKCCTSFISTYTRSNKKNKYEHFKSKHYLMHSLSHQLNPQRKNAVTSNALIKIISPFIFWGRLQLLVGVQMWDMWVVHVGNWNRG